LYENIGVRNEVLWNSERAEHIRSRSQRYPGAFNIEPAWTQEVLTDPDRIVRDPDPKSRSGAMRVIGYSSSAHAVLTVIIDPQTRQGITAWKTTGADMSAYLAGEESS
jgi:hypothetical protein